MLPARTPQLPGYTLWQHWQPCWLVGGDFYDYRLLPGGELLLLTADVAGKGVAAALGMAWLKGTIEVLDDAASSNPERLLKILNESAFSWCLDQIDS